MKLRSSWTDQRSRFNTGLSLAVVVALVSQIVTLLVAPDTWLATRVLGMACIAFLGGLLGVRLTLRQLTPTSPPQLGHIELSRSDDGEVTALVVEADRSPRVYRVPREVGDEGPEACFMWIIGQIEHR